MDVAVSDCSSMWLFLKEKATQAAVASGHSNCETAVARKRKHLFVLQKLNGSIVANLNAADASRVLALGTEVSGVARFYFDPEGLRWTGGRPLGALIGRLSRSGIFNASAAAYGPPPKYPRTVSWFANATTSMGQSRIHLPGYNSERPRPGRSGTITRMLSLFASALPPNRPLSNLLTAVVSESVSLARITLDRVDRW